MKSTYDPDKRELVIEIRPELEPDETIDYSQGTHAPVPLKIITGSIEDRGNKNHGYAISHTWTDIDLEVIGERNSRKEATEVCS